MRKADDRELLRRLAGEPPTGEDEDLRTAAEGHRLAALWAELEAPPAEPAPPGFAGRVMARVRQEAVPAGGAGHAVPRADTLARRFGAVPARLAAASALAAGLIAGAGLGALVAAPGQVDGRTVRVAALDGAGGGAAAAAGGTVEPSGSAAGSREGGAGAPGTPGSAAAGESPAVSGAADEATLLAAAVAAATGEATGGGEGLVESTGPASPFVAEPDLAEGYLTALAALEEAS